MKKALLLPIFSLCLLASCKTSNSIPTKIIDMREFAGTDSFNGNLIDESTYIYQQDLNIIDDNYRNYYEIFVGSFQDSDGDGMGDLQGIIQKLDYLQDLGITGLWLMPINPSPSYHKYDVINYLDTDSKYGTLEDFKELITEANKRQIKIIIDLVINHSSSSHPWFLQAENALRKADYSNKYISYYNFSKTKSDKYHGCSASGWFYEGWFSSNMPDLNMDCPDVRIEFENIAKFWLDFGVAGFRIDAAMHVYSGNHDKNIEFFNWFMDYCRSIKEDTYVVAEVWDSASSVINYYNSTMTSVFNYPYALGSGALARAIVSQEQTGESFIDDLAKFKKQISNNNPIGIDAMFLSNHDNARSANSYWRNIYAIKFAAAVYLMAPGNPFIYYGEEIGMISSGNRDENYRGPMYWDTDAKQLCNPPSGMDEPIYYFTSANKQVNQNNSIHATYKRALRIRNENPEIARGIMDPINSTNQNLGIYKSSYNDDSIFIIHNFGYNPLTINKSELGFTYEQIRGYLSATGEQFVFNSDSIVFPAFSTLILK